MIKNKKIVNRKPKSLSQERDDGNIEYKLKLTNTAKKRVGKIITQMKFRLNEGDGKCMYAIGFTDNGESLGITKDEMDLSIHVMKMATKELKVNINKVIMFTEDEYYWAKIFLDKEEVCKFILHISRQWMIS